MIGYYIIILIGAVGSILNIIKIHLISKKWGFLKPYHQLLLSLACSDLLTSILAIAYGSHVISRKEKEEQGHVKIEILIGTFAFTSINLLAIGFDRYMAIRHPIKHRNCMTRNRMKIAIIVLWIVIMAFLVLIPSIIAIFVNHEHWIDSYFKMLAAEWIYWYGIFMLAFYFMIIFTSLKRRAKLRRRSVQAEARATKHEISLIWTCAFTVFVYFSTNFPYALLVRNKKHPSMVLAILPLSNLIINPIAYLIKTHRDRRNKISIT